MRASGGRRTFALPPEADRVESLDDLAVGGNLANKAGSKRAAPGPPTLDALAVSPQPQRKKPIASLSDVGVSSAPSSTSDADSGSILGAMRAINAAPEAKMAQQHMSNTAGGEGAEPGAPPEYQLSALEYERMCMDMHNKSAVNPLTRRPRTPPPGCKRLPPPQKPVYIFDIAEMDSEPLNRTNEVERALLREQDRMALMRRVWEDAESSITGVSGLTPDHRAVLINWLSQVCYDFQQGRQTFHLAVSFVDQYLMYADMQQRRERVLRRKKARESSDTKASDSAAEQSLYIQPRTMEAMGAACVLLASKVVEPMPLESREVLLKSEHGLLNEVLVHWEVFVLKGLDGAMSATTAFDFVKLYIKKMIRQLRVLIDLERQQHNDEINFAVHQLRTCSPTTYPTDLHPNGPSAATGAAEESTPGRASSLNALPASVPASPPASSRRSRAHTDQSTPGRHTSPAPGESALTSRLVAQARETPVVQACVRRIEALELLGNELMSCRLLYRTMDLLDLATHDVFFLRFLPSVRAAACLAVTLPQILPYIPGVCSGHTLQHLAPLLPHLKRLRLALPHLENPVQISKCLKSRVYPKDMWTRHPFNALMLVCYRKMMERGYRRRVPRQQNATNRRYFSPGGMVVHDDFLYPTARELAEAVKQYLFEKEARKKPSTCDATGTTHQP